LISTSRSIAIGLGLQVWGGCRGMKVLAADGHILCCGLVRTLQLLREDVCVTGADSIDEMLTLIPGLLDLDLVLLDASMPSTRGSI